MFGFYIGKPVVELSDDGLRPFAKVGIEGFGETLSGATRDNFIEAGIVDVFRKYITYRVEENRYDLPIKYSEVKECLNKIRKKLMIHGEKRKRLDDAINSAIKEYGEESLYCIFE